jgi:hypothetical protein
LCGPPDLEMTSRTHWLGLLLAGIIAAFLGEGDARAGVAAASGRCGLGGSSLLDNLRLRGGKPRPATPTDRKTRSATGNLPEKVVPDQVAPKKMKKASDGARSGAGRPAKGGSSAAAPKLSGVTKGRPAAKKAAAKKDAKPGKKSAVTGKTKSGNGKK